jgi:putative endonuclease
MGARRAIVGILERTFTGLGRIVRRNGEAELPQHLRTGLSGEEAALFELLRKGYVVAAVRWRAGNLKGDVDLIAWQGSLLCFIEVKTRTAHDMTPAEVAVDRDKRRMLRRMARAYLRQLPQKEAPPVRFDVMSVYLIPGKVREIAHFQDAFGWADM